MTREEAIEIINRENDPNDKKVWELFPEYREALEMAISALEQEQDMTIAYLMGKYEDKEPCDDAISREAVKELIKCGVSTDTYDDVEQVCKWIDALPSVTQKSGKWIYVREDKYRCSKCGTTTRVDEGGIDEKPMYRFCPYCGAKMESEDKTE